MNAWQVREMIQGWGCRVETAACSGRSDFGEIESFVVVGSLDPRFLGTVDVFTISERHGSCPNGNGAADVYEGELPCTMLLLLNFLVRFARFVPIDIFFQIQLCYLGGFFRVNKDIPILPISSETCEDEVLPKVCGLPNWLWPVEAQNLGK